MNKIKALLRSLPSSELGLSFQPETRGVWVKFRDGRRQFIAIEQRRERYVLTSIVLGRAHVNAIGRLQLLSLIWQRNRETNILAFNLDSRGRLVGQAEQLVDTLDMPELVYYIETLAQECDRLEFILVGQDIY